MSGNVHGELSERIAYLESQGGGTLELDGVYEIDRCLCLPLSVSLTMTPHSILRALPDFDGDAVLVKQGTEGMSHEPSGWIRGGVIDGGRQPLTGLRVESCSRIDISELEVRDATFKGIHIVGPGYENNVSHVRCNVDIHTPYAPGSIGVHYEIADSLVHSVVIIGYETGVRSDSSSMDFSMVHVWNFDPDQGPMLYCFYCNGHGDTYTQCYADSPTIAGFYVTKPFQRVYMSRVYYSRWAADNAGAGILIEPGGSHGTFVGNYFFANQEHTLAKAYDGCVDTACILGDGFRGGVVHGGRESRIPSGGGGEHPLAVLNVAGPSFRLAPRAQAPAAGAGAVGDIAWVDGPDAAVLYLKTSRGWKRTRLEDDESQ